MDEKELIYNFIVNNEKLEKLEVNRKKFNPFVVLKISHHEIRHSNVLAWLLNPKENHNLGDKILKKVVSQIIIDSANEDSVPDGINLKDIQLSSFVDAKVFRESDNVDILVVSMKNKFVLLIENKIYSKESPEQLKEYMAKIKEKYPNFAVLPVFLTVERVEPKGENYCVFDHKSIYEIVNFTVNLHRDNFSKEIYDFIQFYLTTLKDILVMDDKTRLLCRDIYKVHKEAVDLIYDIGNQIDITSAINEFKNKYSEITETYKSNRSFWFAIPEFLKIPKTASTWGGGYPISFWFSDYYGYLKLILEIGPFDKSEERVRFLETLEKFGINITKRAKEIGRQYTRICTDTVKINEWADKEEIFEAMERLYGNNKKMNETKEKLLKAMEAHTW